MSQINVNTIANVSGTTGATIDSAGRILQPTKPAFHVIPSSTQTLTEVNLHQIFQFDTVKFDIGNNFDTTNFNYVCPVDGVYFFSLNARIDVATQGANEYIRVFIYKGSDAATTTNAWTLTDGSILSTITGENATDYETMTVSGVLQCSAGDKVTAMGGHSHDASIGLQYQSQFTGFLVG